MNGATISTTARPDQTSPEASADTLTGLEWPFKPSFLSYIAGIPDGRCVIDHGATVSESHGMVFAPAGASDFDPATGEGTVAFVGRVRFSGHFGMLSLDIVDPWIVVHGGAGVLTIATNASDRLPLVTFDAAFAPSADWIATDVRLTTEGAELFGGAYAVGEPFEPFHAAL